MSENILKKIIDNKILKINSLKEDIDLEKLNKKIIENNNFFDFKKKIIENYS